MALARLAQAAGPYTVEAAQSQLRQALKAVEGGDCEQWAADKIAAGTPERAALQQVVRDLGAMMQAMRSRELALQSEVEAAAENPGLASYDELGRKVADQWLLVEYGRLARTLIEDAEGDLYFTEPRVGRTETPVQLKRRKTGICVGLWLRGGRIKAHEDARRAR